MKNILVLGATSAIAMECAKIWTEEKPNFFLVGRDATKLDQTASDLTIRGANSALTYQLDLSDFSSFSEMLRICVEKLGQIDLVLIAHGTLPNQHQCETSNIDLAKEFEINSLSSILLLNELAVIFEKQKCGKLIIISSVAGDRGRTSNYVYGAAKAALSTYTEGLKGRLFKAGVHVMLVKPGFVRTPMTQGLKLPNLLVATPQKVATEIAKGINKNRNTLYTPLFWLPIMMIIKSIPSAIFKRLPL